MAKLTAEDARMALDRAAAEKPEMVMPILQGMLVESLRRIQQLENVVRRIAHMTGLAGGPPQTQVAGAAAPQQGGVRMGADGNPITDPSQLAAEEAMDAAIGGGDAPAVTAPPQGRPAPPRGGVRMQPAPPPAAEEVRVGADGAPITDAAQLEAERLMDEAAGPRA